MADHEVDSQSSSSDGESVGPENRRVPVQATSKLYGGGNQTTVETLEPASDLGNDADSMELDSSQRQELINDINENSKFVAVKEVLAARRRQLEEILKLRAKEERLLVEELKYQRQFNNRQARALFEISQLRSNSSGRFTIAETILMLRILRQWGGHRKQKDIGDTIFDGLKECGWQISELDPDEESLRVRVVKRLARVSQQSKDRILELGSVGHVNYPWDAEFYERVEKLVDDKLRSANPISRHISKPVTDRRTLANNLKRIAYQPAELKMFQNWIVSLKLQVIERKVRKAYSEHHNARKPSDVIKKVKFMAEDMKAGRGYPSKLIAPQPDTHFDRDCEGLIAQGPIPVAIYDQFYQCLDSLVESRTIENQTNNLNPPLSDGSSIVSYDSSDENEMVVESSHGHENSVVGNSEEHSDDAGDFPVSQKAIKDMRTLFTEAYLRLDDFYDSISAVISRNDGATNPAVNDFGAFSLALQGLAQEMIGQFVVDLPVDPDSIRDNTFLNRIKTQLTVKANQLREKIENMLVEEDESACPSSDRHDSSPGNESNKLDSIRETYTSVIEESFENGNNEEISENPNKRPAEISEITPNRQNKTKRTLRSPRTPEDRAIEREAMAFSGNSIPRLGR